MRPVARARTPRGLATNVHRQSPDVQVFEIGHDLLARIATRTATGPRTRSSGSGWPSPGSARRARWHARRASAWTCTTPRAWPSWRSPSRARPGGDRALGGRAGARLSRAGPRRPARAGRAGARLVRRGGARVREAFDLAAPVFVADIALGALAARPARRAALCPAAALPGRAARPRRWWWRDRRDGGPDRGGHPRHGPPWLARVALFDVYSGSQVGAGRRSLAWSLTFQAPDRTLTDAEVNESHARVVRRSSEPLRRRSARG